MRIVGLLDRVILRFIYHFGIRVLRLPYRRVGG